MAKTKIAGATAATATVQGRKPIELELERNGSDGLHIKVHGDASRLDNATGSIAVSSGLLSQIATLGSKGQQVDNAASNFALGFVDSMKPKDAAEALLMTQMAAVHQATMMMARRLNHVENIPQQDSAERALNKLGRTYAAQMDALKRYRSKGQQTVRVERVTVQEGGQAIVGNVETGGRGHEEK